MAIKRISASGTRRFDHSGFASPAGLVADGKTFVAGISAAEFDPGSSGATVGGDIVEQCRAAYARVARVLDGAGLGPNHVAQVVEYIAAAEIGRYPSVESARAEVFGAHRPAVNTVVVHRLFQPGALIEIEVAAAREPISGDVEASDRAAFTAARNAGGIVYVSTVRPYDANGDLVGEGDVEAQTRQIFRNAESALSACGLSMANVVNTLEMVRPEARSSYKYTGRVRKEYLGPVYPASAGLLQDLVAPDDRVLLSYDFIASVHEPVAINPGLERYEKLTYSPAVRAGNTVFLSGQAAMDPVTEQPAHPGDIAAQTEYIYGNLVMVLEAAGLGPEHFVRTTEFVTPSGAAHYRDTPPIRQQILREPYPASTAVLCHSLLRREFDIEIVSVAHAP